MATSIGKVQNTGMKFKLKKGQIVISFGDIFVNDATHERACTTGLRLNSTVRRRLTA